MDCQKLENGSKADKQKALITHQGKTKQHSYFAFVI